MGQKPQTNQQNNHQTDTSLPRNSGNSYENKNSSISIKMVEFIQQSCSKLHGFRCVVHIVGPLGHHECIKFENDMRERNSYGVYERSFLNLSNITFY